LSCIQGTDVNITHIPLNVEIKCHKVKCLINFYSAKAFKSPALGWLF